MSSEAASAILTIDLEAIAANYQLLQKRLGDVTECAGVVKADAYGLGADKVGPALQAAGCKTFFVAQLSEAVSLRSIVPEPDIFVLNGLMPGQETEFIHHRLFPVLNSLAQVDLWGQVARSSTTSTQHHGAALHVDTGMSRLGLPRDEWQTLAADTSRADGIDLRYLMSHLACADSPGHPTNGEQLRNFAQCQGVFPALPASLSNSSGIFLGTDFHHQMARPGIALYGGNPTPDSANPMAEVVRLKGRIAQVREIDSPMTVGYGATHRVTGPAKIATVPVGYADGYLRCLGNRAFAYAGRHRVPVVGRVSMDLITLDVTGVPSQDCQPGALVDLIGGPVPVDDVAGWADTISYEILTSLGNRYHRVYINGNA